uniref:RxLR effector candidate protein n=1 Tax=Hyaloperonospora arabidopsidis (strain Emoy2) TaxID=559515 RepID=M4BGF3_HYAAE
MKVFQVAALIAAAAATASADSMGNPDSLLGPPKNSVEELFDSGGSSLTASLGALTESSGSGKSKSKSGSKDEESKEEESEDEAGVAYVIVMSSSSIR